MGLFDIINDLLDENSANSLENKLASAVDRVEETLSTVLDKAESGIERASSAVDKLDANASLVEEKVAVVSENTQSTIDIIENKL